MKTNDTSPLSDQNPDRLRIFVVGCQRSGTTLIGQILGAQPRAVLIDEKNGVYPLIDAMLDRPGEEETRSAGCVDSARTIYADGDRFTDPGRITHLILKAPNATHQLNRILGSERTDFRFVFAVRNVYDVVCSMQSLPHIPMVENQVKLLGRNAEMKAQFSRELDLMAAPSTPDHVRKALVWKIKTSLFRRYLEPPLEALLVRYEHLVRNPEVWVPRILRHGDLHPPSGGAIPHESVFRGTGPGGTERDRGIDQRSLRRWDGVLNRKQRGEIAEVAGDLMEELYPRGTIPEDDSTPHG